MSLNMIYIKQKCKNHLISILEILRLQDTWKSLNRGIKLTLAIKVEPLIHPVVEHFNSKVIINFFDHFKLYYIKSNHDSYKK